MVKIRLARHGAKKRPFYRIVAADERCWRDGKFLEIVGTYNPLTEPATVNFKADRVKHWVGQGAQFTYTVKNLLRKKGFFSNQVSNQA